MRPRLAAVLRGRDRHVERGERGPGVPPHGVPEPGDLLHDGAPANGRDPQHGVEGGVGAAGGVHAVPQGERTRGGREQRIRVAGEIRHSGHG
jgi:hypothetical protein